MYYDEFGLFGLKHNIRLYHPEKSYKYLLSFKYIPDNFEGIIIGPSYSDNLDTRDIINFKIYNMSMDSANISEIKYAATNVITRGNIKFIIICLNPYITKDSCLKTTQIDPKDYWLSIFTFFPYIFNYSLKSKEMLHPELDPFHSSEWGYKDSNIWKHKIIFKDVIIKMRKEKSNKRWGINIDPIAYSDLKSIIDLAHNNNIRMLAYYYPLYYEFYGYFDISEWWRYKESMYKLFNEKDIVWDMNTSDYYYITKQESSYSDGHLSNRGAKLVVSVIEDKLNMCKDNL